LANSGLVYIASKVFTSTASAQQIDNCFTSTYENYFITYAGVGSTASAEFLLCRVVDGTSPISTAIYFNSLAYSGTSAMTTTFQGSQTSWKVGLIGDVVSHLNLTLFNPQAAAKTSGTSSYIVSSNNDFLNGNNGLLINNTTQYEGLSFFPTSGTWSGTITVYGYRKA
jgi:hypothetical protein